MLQRVFFGTRHETSYDGSGFSDFQKTIEVDLYGVFHEFLISLLQRGPSTNDSSVRITTVSDI